MNFFTDDRGDELRDLFFESAQELLQSLNDAGLELEARPNDSEIIRQVRRAVHTLKGDSAACGFTALSKLAHEMEDALMPEAIQAAPGALVEVIFTAADTFQTMLSAYRKQIEPPSGDALREHIKQIARNAKAPETASPLAEEFLPRFDWNEIQQQQIAEALRAGETVFHVALQIDPASGMRAAAFELIRKALEKAGTILALEPAEATAVDRTSQIEAALATDQSKEEITRKCKIPAVVSGFVIEDAGKSHESSQDLVGLLIQAEGNIGAPTAAPKPVARPAPSPPPASSDEKNAARASATLAAAENSIRVDVTRIDTVLNLVGELIISKSMLHRTFLEFDRRHAKDPLRSRFVDALALQSRVLEDLQRSVMKIRMVPVEQLFRRFPRPVRDIAKQCKKDVKLEIGGENTDLDKSILDALAEPLAHLVRNAVDHGIERAEERAAARKPHIGTVRLDAYHRGNQVVIEVSDDGRGIDRKKLKQRAVAQGVISEIEAAKLSDADSTRLIFEPGLSTAEEVTQVSGRGVGMDVVAGAIEKMKGTIEVESRVGAGTKFRLLVPLTLASIQALMFQAGGCLYAVPLANVAEITRVMTEEIHHVEDYDVIQLRDQLLTLVHLERLSEKVPSKAGKRAFVIVISINDRKFGLLVDSLLGEEELVIKALDDKLAASELVSGASILGDGTVVLILNIAAVATRLARLPALGAIA